MGTQTLSPMVEALNVLQRANSSLVSICIEVEAVIVLLLLAFDGDGEVWAVIE